MRRSFFNTNAIIFMLLSVNILWHDPGVEVGWRISIENVVLSEKDGVHPNLRNSGWLFNYSEILY